ncbi:MAG: restriction endonuclease subunit S [Candidatus Omnitrophica bacterium]|nr:restriction endonuclease subunit S [Candidatus Omnitrophota bacterium]
MNSPTIGNSCNITTGKLDSNHAVSGGKFPFFTCAVTPDTIDSFAFDDNVVLVAGNNAQGNFHVNRYKGKFNAYQRTYVLTAKPEFEIDFIYYSLKLELKRLKERCQGSQTKFLTKPILTSIHLRDIDKIAQQKIGAVLSALDSKIELNNCINSELEAMAKTLYDYWFVQFDFPDKNGKPYKTSGGKMVWNEKLKRDIPEGWKVKRIGDFGEFKNGINYDPSLEGDTDAKIINVRNISSSNLFISQYDLDIIRLQESNVNNYLVTDKDILIARSGIPGATRMMFEFAKNTIYCGFIIRFQVNTLIEKNYLFYFLKDMEKNTTSKSGGTIMSNVNQDTMKRMIVIEPNDQIVIKFNEFINPIFSKINGIIQENQKLTELRDWLLPMLMNGQVKVS